MLLFIHNNFKLDLTYLQVTFSEQNQWFKDDFSTEISFPFDLYLDSELSKNSGFQDHYNANISQTIFNGVLDKDGTLVDAVLKFESIIGKTISALLNAGLDNFPSFNKKLSDLPLEKKSVSDIVVDAESVIFKDYPETNYNFPMVHTNKYDPSNEEWNGFEKIINKFKNGAFVKNEMQDSDSDLIKNIIQPLPYAIHVLKTGIEDAGFILEGDILNDLDLKQALLFRDGDYFERLKEDLIPMVYQNNQWDSLGYIRSGYQHVSFDKEIVIEKKGNYLLQGEIVAFVYRYTGLGLPASTISIEIEKITPTGTTQLYIIEENGGEHPSSENFGWTTSLNIDMSISFNAGDKIRIKKFEARRDLLPSPTPDYPEAISLNLIPVRYLNPDGSPILSVLNLKEIDLKRVVPDMNFRDYVIALKNWKNYGFVPDGKIIRMDLIDPQLDRTKAISLTDEEIEEPKRTFHDSRQFELSFSEGRSNSNYKYDSVLVTKEGNVINDYVAKENVSQIKIDALPLPVVTKSGIKTALSFEDETSKLRLVFMKKVIAGGAPMSYLNENVLLPKIALTNYKNWLNFRINSQGWDWDFLISVEKFKEIKLQSLIYAYKNYHLFSEIQKERLDKSWWRISAKTETLE
jgi:hypothetical protein